jgi:hypothetical protein
MLMSLKLYSQANLLFHYYVEKNGSIFYFERQTWISKFF